MPVLGCKPGRRSHEDFFQHMEFGRAMLEGIVQFGKPYGKMKKMRKEIQEIRGTEKAS